MKTVAKEIRIGSVLYKRYMFHPYVVIGETSHSWLVWDEGKTKPSWVPDIKVPKRNLPEGWTLNKQEWDDWCFGDKWKWDISEAVKSSTGAQLRAVAKIIGWEEPRKDDL